MNPDSRIVDPSALRIPGIAPSEAVVHLSAECLPHARTGGLAEAVRGIANHQARAGRSTSIVLPLYLRVRESSTPIEPMGDPFDVQMPWGVEPARILVDRSTGPGEPRILFVEHEGFFGRPGIYGEQGDYPDNHLRFAFFCQAVLDRLPHIAPGPTILHPHDWHTALAPIYLRSRLARDDDYRHVAVVLTVHNAGYQGHYGPEVLGELGLDPSLFRMDLLEWYGQVNLLKGALVVADMVTTVSPTHAHELRTRTGGFGLHDTFNQLQDRLVGILNGIDYSEWDPACDPALEATYTSLDLAGKARCKIRFQEEAGLDLDPDRPLFAMSARLVEQKGFDILLGADMIPRLDAQWAFLGEGEARYEEAIRGLTEANPGRMSHCFDFNEEREHRLLAAADFLLMPSLYEPCGLTQMRAQRYGALPVARRVGGLHDTVDDRITGFLFDEYRPRAFEEAVGYAIDLYRDRESWAEHVRVAMSRDFSWRRSAAAYDEVYRAAREHRAEHLAREEAGSHDVEPRA